MLFAFVSSERFGDRNRFDPTLRERGHIRCSDRYVQFRSVDLKQLLREHQERERENQRRQINGTKKLVCQLLAGIASCVVILLHTHPIP